MALSGYFIPLVLAATTAPGTDCTPIPGWVDVVKNDQLRWIIIGEMHGNNETPAIFTDAVCLTAKKRGPVVVALELPSSEQATLDRFMASDGGERAREELLKGPFWNRQVQDGRSSKAYFRLVIDVHRMRQAGQVDSVIAFQPTGFITPGQYERDMADLLRSAGKHGATVIALVGDVHARRAELSFKETYLPMAAHLPSEQAVTLNAEHDGGETWACHGQPMVCGTMSFGPPVTSRKRSVKLNRNPDETYSGTLYIGKPTTASPPQRQDLTMSFSSRMLDKIYD